MQRRASLVDRRLCASLATAGPSLVALAISARSEDSREDGGPVLWPGFIVFRATNRELDMWMALAADAMLLLIVRPRNGDPNVYTSLTFVRRPLQQ